MSKNYFEDESSEFGLMKFETPEGSMKVRYYNLGQKLLGSDEGQYNVYLMKEDADCKSPIFQFSFNTDSNDELTPEQVYKKYEEEKPNIDW